MAARSAPHRLLGPFLATGGEAGPNLNTAAEDEGVTPNTVSGSAVPEGRRMERNGIQYYPPSEEGSVCNMEHRGRKYCNLQVITNEITRLKAKIYAISSDTHQLQCIKLHHFKLKIF